MFFIFSSNITTDDKALNGEETADSEHLATEEEEAVINACYYDKSKSFFDNLSCDDLRYVSDLHIVRLKVGFYSCSSFSAIAR